MSEGTSVKTWECRFAARELLNRLIGNTEGVTLKALLRYSRVARHLRCRCVVRFRSSSPTSTSTIWKSKQFLAGSFTEG